MVTQADLNVLVEALVGKDLADTWWTSPNKAFDNTPPKDADLIKVRDYLVWHSFGAMG